MRRHRSTKIVATIGPATACPEMIERLFMAGVDVFRLNFSHGTWDDHRAAWQTIRDLETRCNHRVSVMADLQGPKLRIGQFSGGTVELAAGQAFRLDLCDTDGNAERVCLPHPEIFEAARPGLQLLLDDGRVRLNVRTVTGSVIDAEVESGGTLSDRKGVNVPGTRLNLTALSDKDRADLGYALDLGVDWIALSFVQRPEDLAEARRLINGRARVMTKLEKPAAIEHLDELVELSDAVMVARGDLGVELPPEKVPGVQKRIVKQCRQLGKPVVVATQMLDSMVAAPAPTRAEASDVAAAVYESADAVMLSAETATGMYPVEAVSMMDRIIKEVEQDSFYHAMSEASHEPPEPTVSDAITLAARQVAHTVNANCIVTYTTSGSTTLRAARERPDVPILCITSNIDTARFLSIAWGVHGVHIPVEERFSAVVKRAVEITRSEGFARSGEKIVITAGVPMGTPGSTNVLRVERVP